MLVYRKRNFNSSIESKIDLPQYLQDLVKNLNDEIENLKQTELEKNE